MRSREVLLCKLLTSDVGYPVHPLYYPYHMVSYSME